MRKLITTGLIAFLAIVMSAATVQAQNPTSGTTGPLTWKYDTGTKTLTISGKGEITEKAPWDAFKETTTNLVIEEGVTSIGGSVFQDFTALISVTFPKSLTRILALAFDGCNKLPSVKFPDSMEQIGYLAFNECESLTSVELPKNLSLLAGSAFRNCVSLTSVTVPAGVKRIIPSAFEGCKKLSTITVETDNPNYVSEDGLLFNKAKTTLVLYLAGRGGTTFTIPSGVTAIGSLAFGYCELIEVKIPAGVKDIDASAFSNSEKLSAVTVDAGNADYTSAEGVLFDKAKKTLVRYPEGKTGTAYAIPAGVTNIEEAAFLNCSKLTTVTIPVGVKKIGSHAFARSGLSSVAIPAGIDTISDGAFGDCWNLASITLPSSVKAIGEIAFFACRNLRDLTVGIKTPPVISKHVFEGVPVANVTLTVPKGSKAAYAAAPVWKEFKQISESTVGNVTLPKARIYAADGRLYLTLQTAAPVGIYTLNGVLVRTFSAPAGETTVTLPQGVYIVRVGERTEKVAVD